MDDPSVSQSVGNWQPPGDAGEAVMRFLSARFPGVQLCDREEICNTTFVRYYTQYPSSNGSVNVALLITIAKGAGADFLKAQSRNGKRRSRPENFDAVNPELGPSEAAERRDLFGAARRILDDLVEGDPPAKALIQALLDSWVANRDATDNELGWAAWPETVGNPEVRKRVNKMLFNIFDAVGEGLEGVDQ